jgi:hypothetical protein
MTDFRDMATRAGWTAAETFLALVLASGTLDLGVSTVEAAGVGAISAALTVVLVWVRQRRAASE